MVRRRTASPRASPPVRSRAAPAPQPTYTAPPRTTAPMPTSAPAYHAPPPGAAPSKGPGLFGQMAATAGGVAIGSAVGHAVGNMMTGSGGHEAPAAQPAALAQQPLQQPCEIEWRQFLECSQNQSDLNLCQSYNDLFKQCKTRYGA